ncbi:hypothetical protein JW978_03965 [Candidatus Dojkabacteria bacterium]|nr:hypothetical protein [Candidatus Dojkabacteria bacterium]
MQFLTDGAIVSLCIGLVVVAFLVTVALSPINYEESDFAVANQNSILGEASLKGLEYEPIWRNSSSFSISQDRSDNTNYRLALNFDSLERALESKLVRITNKSGETRKLFIRADSSLAIEDSAVVILKNESSKAEIALNSSAKKMFALRSGESMEFEISVEPKTNINFSAEILLEFSS